MKQKKQEEGFILVLCMIMMVVLTIIGIVAVKNTSFELQIAGNDRVHKRTFYEAEGGVMAGIEVLEQSFACPQGFTMDPTQQMGPTGALEDVSEMEGDFRIYTQNGDNVLWNNVYPVCSDLLDNTKADVAYPLNDLAGTGIPDNPRETGYLYYGSETKMLAGGAIQQWSGYEGLGKGAAQGGVAKFTDVYSKFQGLNNSETIVLMGWRHLVQAAGMTDCKY